MNSKDQDRFSDKGPISEPAPVVKQRRLLNRWSMFALFFVSSAATVGYVSNVIAVNKLSSERDQMRRAVDSMRILNQSLRTESFRLQSADRIISIATTRLGMIAPPEAPTVLTEH